MCPTRSAAMPCPRGTPMMPSLRLSAACFLSLSERWQNAIRRELTADDARTLLDAWQFHARDEQQAPEGAWRIWLFLGGRGAGKTRSGAEWIAQGVRERTMQHIGLIGATFNDARA